jgi:rsbT antagonist protein RsbS
MTINQTESAEPFSEKNRIPVIRMKGYLIVAIHGSLHDRQALQLQEDILLKIEQTGANGLVLDISAVPIMDSYIARILNNIARNAQLMGAQSVIVGMRPVIAITLVTMGLEFENLETAKNLDGAIDLLGKHNG